MNDSERHATARSNRLDFEEQIEDLREQVKRKRRFITFFHSVMSLGVGATAALIVLDAIFSRHVLTVSALAVGGFTAITGLLLASDYGFTRDQKSVLEARLRRVRVAALDAGAGPASMRDIRLGYRASLPDVVESYRLQARRLRRVHNFLQVTVILGSLSASALISLARTFTWASFAAILNTLVVGAAATISSYFKFKERSLTAQGAADSLEAELRAAELLLTPYDRGTADEVLEKLVAASEKIRSEHKTQERQLDQIAEVTYPPLNGGMGGHKDQGSG